MLKYRLHFHIIFKEIYIYNIMSKTLVIILSETRAHELTFDNFKKNVIDELNADLSLWLHTQLNCSP